MDSQRNKNTSSEPQDLNLFVKDMLDQMESEFNQVGHSIMGRMNEMGSRLDCLEQSITDLMEQAGLDSPPPSPRQNESPVSSPQNENRAVL